MHIENQYLQLCATILSKGIKRQNRTGIDAYTIPCTMLQHDMQLGFPLMTHRKLPIKSTLVELEGFLKGITSKKWYQERGCKYWDYWANPEVVNLKYDQQVAPILTQKEIQKQEDDLGPIYGAQWRNFDGHYGKYDTWEVGEPNAGGEYQWTDNRNGLTKGTDQLKNILETLVKNPSDRRMVCSGWNPNQMHMMALPPCHFAWGVISLNGTLNLWWSQRSVDTVCGLSQNITSYATLLLLLSKYSGQTPGTLTGFLCDTHIYENHVNGVKEFLRRGTRQLPQLYITNEWPFDLFSKELVQWNHKEYDLIGYNPFDAMKFEVAV